MFRYVKLIMTNYLKRKSQLSGIVNPYYLTAFSRKYTGLFSFKQLLFFFCEHRLSMSQIKLVAKKGAALKRYLGIQ